MTKPNLPTMVDEILWFKKENERLKKKVEIWEEGFAAVANNAATAEAEIATYWEKEVERLHKEADILASIIHNLHFPVTSVLLKGYVHACEKHPVFAENSQHALSVIESELNELKHAVAHESPERQRAEAMDVAVTAIRFWLGEHNPMKKDTYA